jgi:hypothetical protein
VDPVQQSQLLMHIRLLDAAGEFAAARPDGIFACFHLNGAQTLACVMPVQHQVREATESLVAPDN